MIFFVNVFLSVHAFFLRASVATTLSCSKIVAVLLYRVLQSTKLHVTWLVKSPMKEMPWSLVVYARHPLTSAEKAKKRCRRNLKSKWKYSWITKWTFSWLRWVGKFQLTDRFLYDVVRRSRDLPLVLLILLLSHAALVCSTSVEEAET